MQEFHTHMNTQMQYLHCSNVHFFECVCQKRAIRQLSLPHLESLDLHTKSDEIHISVKQM